MLKTITLCTLIALFSIASCWAKGLRATTDDGRAVILKGDGTWSFLQPAPAAKGGFARPAGAQAQFKVKGDRFAIWYDPNQWHPKRSDNAERELLVHRDGDVYAMLIVERIGMTREALRELAIRNAKNAAPDIKVIHEDVRTVNGKEVLCMQLEGTIEGIRFTYFGYYYADQNGVVQAITYTSQNLFREYEGEMAELLNGLTVNY